MGYHCCPSRNGLFIQIVIPGKIGGSLIYNLYPKSLSLSHMSRMTLPATRMTLLATRMTASHKDASVGYKDESASY
jgi:hypothetical protein